MPEIVQEIGSYAGYAAMLGLAVLAGLYFSQARDVKRLREWAGRAPEDVQVDPELAARQAAAPAQGAVTPKPAVPKPASKPATAAGKAAPAAAGAASAASKQAPAAPGAAPAGATAKQPAPATATGGGAAATAGESAAGATAAGPGGGTAAPPKPGVPPPAAGKTATGAPAVPPPKIPRPGAPGTPSTLPPRRPPTQTRIVPPYGPADEPQRRSRLGRLLAEPRVLVLTILAALVLAGGVAYGALQLTGDDEPAGEQSAVGGSGGGEKGGGKAAPVDPSTVTVSVLNGTTIPGLAAQVGDEVERRGFQLGNVTNSAEQGARAESAVLYAPGSEREAIAVARRLKISQREPINPESQALGGDATVVVVVGADQTQ